MDFLEKLKAHKREKGLTNAEIARLSNIPETTITKIFNGETPDPRFGTIAQIAIAMGVSVDELAGLKSSQNNPISSPVVATLDSYAELLKEKDQRILDLKTEIKEVRREKHRFAFALASIVGIFLIILIVDILNGHFGYFRY